MATQIKAVKDKLLTNVSIQLVPQGYISERVLPLLTVKNRTGSLGKYANEHLRIVNTVVGGRGQYPMVDSVVRSDTNYKIVSHALKDILTSEDYDNVEKPYDAEKDSTIALTTHLWLGKEKSLADTMTNPAIITQNITLSGTGQFSDYTNSNPLGVLKDGRIAVRGGCGFAPNKAGMDWAVAETLRFHPQLLEKLGYKDNRPGGLNDQELARALNVDEVLIAQAVYNSSKKGQADSIGPVWGKHIVLFYAPSSAQLRQQSLGYRLQLTRRGPRQVFKADMDEPVDAKKIMVLDDYEQLLTNVNCAYLIEDAIA